MLTQPFEPSVWLCLLVALVTVTATIFLISNAERLVGLDADYYANLGKCVMFVYGTLMGEINRTKGFHENAWASRYVLALRGNIN